jgi:hypothetical protein
MLIVKMIMSAGNAAAASIADRIIGERSPPGFQAR